MRVENAIASQDFLRKANVQRCSQRPRAQRHQDPRRTCKDYQNRDLELLRLCGLLNGYLAEVILWLEDKEGRADPSALAKVLGLLEDICKVRLHLSSKLCTRGTALMLCLRGHPRHLCHTYQPQRQTPQLSDSWLRDTRSSPNSW